MPRRPRVARADRGKSASCTSRRRGPATTSCSAPAVSRRSQPARRRTPGSNGSARVRGIRDPAPRSRALGRRRRAARRCPGSPRAPWRRPGPETGRSAARVVRGRRVQAARGGVPAAERAPSAERAIPLGDRVPATSLARLRPVPGRFLIEHVIGVPARAAIGAAVRGGRARGVSGQDPWLDDARRARGDRRRGRSGLPGGGAAARFGIFGAREVAGTRSPRESASRREHLRAWPLGRAILESPPDVRARSAARWCRATVGTGRVPGGREPRSPASAGRGAAVDRRLQDGRRGGRRRALSPLPTVTSTN